MSNTTPQPCGVCSGAGWCGGKGKQTLRAGLWNNNPLFVQILGICSSLAVTNKLETALVMGFALIVTCAGSNFLVSLLRDLTPSRVRMIAELTIISVFVIMLDQFLKAFYWDMSKQLGPYVGLIITNCIVMGRAEAFALQNPPMVSIVDGAANGAGYAAILAIIGTARELLGTGKILGHPVLQGAWFTPNQIMIMAPGAFFMLALLLTVYNAVVLSRNPEAKKT